MVTVVNSYCEAVVVEGSSFARVTGEDGDLERSDDEGRR